MQVSDEALPSPFFLNSFRRSSVRGRAMLDGVDACFQSDLDAFGTFNVGRGAKPKLMCFIAHRLRDIERHAQDSRLAFDFGIKNAARDEELDLIGSIAEVLMDESATLRGSLLFSRTSAHGLRER